MLIAFSGLAGSGKTTAASHLVEAHNFVRLRFAEPLKAMLKVLIEPAGDVDRWIDGDYKEKVHPLLNCTPRHAMQTLGTEWGRNCIDTDLWVRLAINRIMRMNRDVVIDDVRFESEFLALNRLGGTVYRIVRSHEVTTSTHASERGCSFHHTLPNFGSHEDFQIALDDLIMGERMARPQHK